MMKRLSMAAAALTMCMAMKVPALSQDREYPTRSVTIIVPAGPGGGTDIIARVVGEHLSKRLAQPFIIENRPGAGLLIGTAAAAKTEPDGYTLLIGLNGNMAVNPSLFSKLPYDPIRDFVPVAMLANYPFLVVASKNLQVASIKELIALAKTKPGDINYASTGSGAGQHLSVELFKMMTGTNFAHIPYRSSAAAYPDVISGQVPVFFDNISSALSQVKGGTVRGLAITSKQRSPIAPDLPTVEESGVAGFDYYTWFGLWAPRNTPQSVIEKLHAEVRKILDDPAVRESIIMQGGEPSTMPLAEIEPFVKAEIVKWADVVKRAGVKVQ